LANEKQIKSYILHLEPEFNSDLQNSYVDFFRENGIPSKNKQGAVFDLCRSLPAYNKNDLGLRPEILEASYKTIVHTLGNLNHRRDLVIGSTIRSDLIKNENEPTVMRVCAVFWKDRLRDHDIESIAQQNGFSMEALFTDWEFLINGKIYTRDEKPDITEEQVDDLILRGKPIYDSNGNRVVVLAGTLEKPIEFSGFGVIIEDKNPADPLSDKTYLEVASEKNNKNGDDLKVELTEQQLHEKINEAIASVKAEYEGKLQTIQASITEKENQFKELEALLATEKEAKEKAESELQKVTISTRFETRKTALASKGITYRPEKEDFIKTSSDEAFNDWFADMEAIAVSASKTLEAKAEKLGLTKELIASINLTGEEENPNAGKEIKTEKTKLIAF
jgi:hypothetical protein